MKSGDNRRSYHHREEKRKQEEKKKIEIIDVVIKRKMKNVAKYESVKVKARGRRAIMLTLLHSKQNNLLLLPKGLSKNIRFKK